MKTKLLLRSPVFSPFIFSIYDQLKNKTMKKIIFIATVISLMSLSSINAQFGIGSPKVLDEIKKNKLIVVLFQDADHYNEYLQNYVEKNWKYGDYEFVYSDKLKAYKKSKDVFFLAMKKVYYSTLLRSNSLTISNNYELEIPWGSKSNIAIVPTFIQDINSISKEHLETLLKVLFDVLVEIRKGGLKQIKGKKVAEYYNPQNNVSKFYNKTLLIPESSITIGYPGKENRKFFDSKEIAKFYTQDFKIVTEEELTEFLISDNGQYIYFHSSELGPIIFFYLFDIQQNKMVYFGNYRQGVGSMGNLSVFERVLEDLNQIMQ
jgi:hypothetical protein